jgi:hypothetical protein
MSSTLVNGAVPEMIHRFALGQQRAQWVSSGSMVAMIVSLLCALAIIAAWRLRHEDTEVPGAPSKSGA